jgi:hypothetical protein
VPQIVAVGLVAGLLAGLLMRGRLTAIGEAQLRLWWLASVALAVQILLIRVAGDSSSLPWWMPLAHVASYALLLLVVWANRRTFGLPLVGIGLLMNTVVIAANGGMMPQAPETSHYRHPDAVAGEYLANSKTVLLPRDQTTLWWLSDTIVIPSGTHLPLIASPGDLVLAAGLAATVYGLTRPAGRRSAAIANPGELKGLPS